MTAADRIFSSAAEKGGMNLAGVLALGGDCVEVVDPDP